MPATPLLLLLCCTVAAAREATLANASLAELRRVASEHLHADDHQIFERVTGTSVATLLADSAWRTTSRRIMNRILGINKIVAHELNARGLHVLRALLSERIADHVRRSRGYSTAHPLHDRFMQDGILVFHDVQNISSTLDGLFDANDHQVEGVLRMVSGFKQLGASGFTSWDTHTHVATDPQYYMHVDTYHPTWKIFVFRRTPIEAGPLHYVYGSHRSTEGKLRWLYNRTRMLVSTKQTPTKTYDALGPFSEATHGFHPSLRVLGFDPVKGASGQLPQETFRGYGFPPPTPIVAGEGMTLVVVDVSGLHFRGWAQPGTQRVSSGFAGKGGGCLVCIPRKSPFHCEKLPPDC